MQGKISILINKEYTTIEVTDPKSAIRFLDIRLTPEQLSAALSRQAMVDCDLTIRGLDLVGKKQEYKQMIFPLPEGKDRYDLTKNELAELAEKHCPKGWVSDNYFGSQDSFFVKDDKNYACCTIRQWI